MAVKQAQAMCNVTSMVAKLAKSTAETRTVLTELERHEGLCILATNRPMDLDEAMHRRITLAIEFSKPDLLLREKIWRSMAPPKLPLAEDVDRIAVPVLRHRIVTNFNAEAEGLRPDDIIARLIKSLPADPSEAPERGRVPKLFKSADAS